MKQPDHSVLDALMATCILMIIFILTRGIGVLILILLLFFILSI